MKAVTLSSPPGRTIPVLVASAPSYLNSEITFKFSVKDVFAVKVNAITSASCTAPVTWKNSGLNPKANLSEKEFSMYKAAPWYPAVCYLQS